MSNFGNNRANIHDNLRHIGRLNNYMNDDYVVEEIHASRDNTVRFYEIPLNQRNNANHNNHNGSVNSNTRINNPSANNHVTTRVNHESTTQSSTQHTHDNTSTQQTSRPNRLTIQSRMTEDEQRQIQELTEQIIQEEREERDQKHDARIEELSNLVHDYDPNHHLLFTHFVNDAYFVRLACEINDPCYSCSYNYFSNGLLKIIQMVNPTLYAQAKPTLTRDNKATFKTDQFFIEHNVIHADDRGVPDLIFDMHSLIQASFASVGHTYVNYHTPVYVHIDDHNDLYFNQSHICRLSKSYDDVPNGLIHLTNLKRNEHTQSIIDNEKKILKMLSEEMWVTLINILRNKYKLFNTIPNIVKPIRPLGPLFLRG